MRVELIVLDDRGDVDSPGREAFFVMRGAKRLVTSGDDDYRI